MSSEHDDRGAGWARRRRLRRIGLGGVLATLAALAIHAGLLGSRGRTAVASCLAAVHAPEVKRVAPGSLSALREDVARTVPQRIARLYEEGAVLAASAWSDEEPQPPAVSPTALRPDGYEMRWWAPNGDDVVADALVFADAASAQRFLTDASSTRCRNEATRGSAPSPAGAHNVSWLNPDGAAQADVYFARGSRVYRLADAPAGQSGAKLRPGSLRRAFLTIDTLACLLPGAQCTEASRGVPA